MFQKNPRKALILGVSTILMWSSVSTAFKIALDTLEPFQLIFLGLLTASIILATYVLYTGEWKSIKAITKKDCINIFAQGLALYFYYLFLFSAYELLPAQIVQPINATWAFVLALMSTVVLKEKFSLGEGFGMMIAYGGVVVIALGGAGAGDSGFDVTGIAFSVICTVFLGAYWIINNRCTLSHKLSLLLGFFVASMLALITLVVSQTSFDNLTMVSFFSVLYLGLFEWGIPFLTWSLALRLTNSIPMISSLSFFTPFLSLIFVSFILKEPILWTTVIGIVLIVGGTIVQQKFKKSRELR